VKDIYESRMMQLVGIGIEDSSVERFYPEYDIVQELIDLESVLMKLLKGKMMLPLGGSNLVREALKPVPHLESWR